MTYWLIFTLFMVLSIFVQNMLQSRFRKYSKVPLRNSMSGADVARKMLQENGIYDVNVMCIPGQLTDHYNPATKTVNLSEEVYNGRSVAATLSSIRWDMRRSNSARHWCRSYPSRTTPSSGYSSREY